RVPRPDLAVPDLGPADLVDPRADVGHARDPHRRERRTSAPERRRVHPDRARLRGDRRRAPRTRPARGPRAGDALADVRTNIRIFFVGGLLSYRALFGWLSPWVLIPTFAVAPIFQILLFVYIGRSAHLESDRFYVIGNALQYAAIPCLFAMANTIAGERNSQTLGPLLASPAPRLPLFLGRSLPVIVNGMVVAAFGLAVGSAILGVHVPASAFAPLVLVIAVT